VQDLQACDFSRFEIQETVLDETVRRAMENLRFKYVEKEEERFASLEEDNYVLSTQELRNHLETIYFQPRRSSFNFTRLMCTTKEDSSARMLIPLWIQRHSLENVVFCFPYEFTGGELVLENGGRPFIFDFASEIKESLL
jgi:hypothetical protein